MKIERVLIVEDSEERERVWNFYDSTFESTRGKTPISQSWPKEQFVAWLSNPMVIKFIMKDLSGAIKGLVVLSDDLELDWLISKPYFENHYPGKHLFNWMSLAISEDSGTLRCLKELCICVFNEIPPDGMVVTTFSTNLRSGFLGLAERLFGAKIQICELDSLGVAAFTWKE